MTDVFSFPVGLPIDWQRITHVNNTIGNDHLKSWLSDEGSLTEKLERYCRQLSVHVIGQGVAPLHENETLAMGNHEPFCVREVLLLGDQTPWVFARSLIPVSLLADPQSDLATIGNQPLGRLLFNDPRFERGEFEVGQIDLTTLPLLDYQSPNSIRTPWARRSTFAFETSRIMVAELFLPSSPAYQKAIN